MAPRLILTPGEIRDASLPKSLRGFDESATRRLLEQVAETVQAHIKERDRLQRLVDEAEAGAAREPAADDPAAIGTALLAAQRAGEALLQEAREGAEQITAAARAEAEGLLERARQSATELESSFAARRDELEREHDRLHGELDDRRAALEEEVRTELERARAEAEALTAESRQRLEALRREEEAVRAAIAERRRHFVEMLQSALDQVGGLDSLDAARPDELADFLTARATDTSHGTRRAAADGDAEAPPVSD